VLVEETAEDFLLGGEEILWMGAQGGEASPVMLHLITLGIACPLPLASFASELPVPSSPSQLAELSVPSSPSQLAELPVPHPSAYAKILTAINIMKFSLAESL
jgi:hypothetical protein